MISSSINKRPAILLASGIPEKLYPDEGKKEYSLPLHQRIDEAAVSISRAVFASKARLLVPFDEEFAPLIAQVANEYITPQYAEGPDAVTFEESPEQRETAIQLFQIGSKPDQTVAKKMKNPWLQLLVDLRVVASEAPLIKTLLPNFDPLTVFAIGTGQRVMSILKEIEAIRPNVNVYGFRSCGELPPQEREKVRFFDDHILSKLEEVRTELKTLYDEREPDDFRPEKDDSPEKRFQFIPYALISQLLVAEVMGDDRMSHPDYM